jgi:hypothetical protein
MIKKILLILINRKKFKKLKQKNIIIWVQIKKQITGSIVNYKCKIHIKNSISFKNKILIKRLIIIKNKVILHLKKI